MQTGKLKLAVLSVSIANLCFLLTWKQVLGLAEDPVMRYFQERAPHVGLLLALITDVWILASIVLFVLVALFGQEVNGAKLWIRFGSLQFEPIEAIKLFVVLFMAAYLAETGDVIAAARPWSLRANAKYLGPLFIGWGTSVGILVFERDVGTAALCSRFLQRCCTSQRAASI